MDPKSLESLRECKLNLLEILEVQSRDWATEHYKQLIKKAGNEAKLIITTTANYLLQLKEELKDLREILRKLNIKMAEEVLGIVVKGLFTDGETLETNEKDELKSLKSDEFRFEYGEADTLHDRQVNIKLNLDIKKSIIQTREILDEVDDDIMVNTTAVEKLEDFIQKWAEKLLEEEEADKPTEEEEIVPANNEEEGADTEAEKEEEGQKNKERTLNGDETNQNNESRSTEVEEIQKEDRLSQNVDDEDVAKSNNGENQISDDIDKDTLKLEVEENTIDDKKLKGRSRTLTSMKTDKLDAIPESEDDEKEEDTVNIDEMTVSGTTAENVKNGEKQNPLEKDEDPADESREENNDEMDNQEKKDDDDQDEDLETQMMNELQEQEKQKLEDPFPEEDWDTFVFHQTINQPENQDKEIICVVIAKRDMLRRNDVMCVNSHNPNDLRECLRNKHEKLLSFFVTVSFAKEPVDKNECFVFVPYHQPSKMLDYVIRIRSHDGQWTDLPPHDISKLTSVPGVNFSGITVQGKFPIGLIVVAHGKPIRYNVPEGGIAVEPANDRNITLLVSPVTFSKETHISCFADEILPESLRAYKKQNMEIKNVASVSARLHLVCEMSTEDELSVIFYDLLRKASENEESDNLPYCQKEALSRCWRQLVNELTIDTLVERMEEWGIRTNIQLGGEQFSIRQKIENEETLGDKARLILKEIEKCTLEDFNSFIICLRESSQPYLAKLLTDTVERIKKEPKTASAFIFLGKTNMKILVRRDNGPWVPSNPVVIPERPDDLVVVLPSGGCEFQIVVVNLSGHIMKRDLCNFADDIISNASESRTSLICRQHSTRPEKITIQCVREEDVESRIRHLKDNGYTLGLQEDIQFGMCDGETLEITFDLNIGLVDIGEDGVLRLHYFDYLDTARMFGDLFLVDERAQSQEPLFSGDLYYNVGSVKQRPPRTGCFKITLPKSAAPYIDRTPFRMLHVQVIALAKYIGYRVGPLGRDSVLRFAQSLVDDVDLRRRLYVKVRRVCRGKDDRARCEMFIINWARQRLKFEDKVVLLLDALWFEPDIQADAKDFALVYSNSGILCDHYLQKMSEFIGEEWITLGRKLCIPDRDLNLLRIDYKDKAVRNFKLLDTFRFSRIAIEQGTSVIRFLLRACKSAGCSAGLITFIRYIAGIFKELTFMRPQSWMSMSSAMPSVEIT
ncbi:uncharacterized protein LOC133172252 [Saccostrea echinata]|uniref:uncharacterized protein LOC133172252 n=1 Tax=Saccostrea echinata TaxID=191078 RepID=UPI002A81153B|nr:uncharacterized protein LOC133172252 [Saccostrea echinata]